MKSRRIIVRRDGGPEVQEYIEKDVGKPRAGDARVKLLMAGASFADMPMREGVHPQKTILPFTPGWDLVGVVDKLGSEDSGFTIGRKVAALPIHGGCAEHIYLRNEERVPVPDGLDPVDVTSLVLN